MIWSCEINYSGWEDDINHYHFFIESESKPTEEEVVQHYNLHHFVAGKGNFVRKATEDEKDWHNTTGWVALYSDGEVEYYDVYIHIKPLKVEKLDGKV